MARSLLLICRQSPWSGPSAREALDLALAGGAFDLPVSLLFLDDGVFQLCDGQQPARLEQKDLCANLRALPLFGVEALYAGASDLRARGLATKALALPVTPLEDAALAALFDQHDLLVTL